MLHEKGIPYGGILCPGKQIAYFPNGNARQFLYTEEIPESIKIGKRYHIRVAEIEQAKKEIIKSAEKKAHTFIDEFGKLELRGGGLYEAIERVMVYNNNIILVRERNFDEFMTKFNDYDIRYFMIDKKNRDEIPVKVINFITGDKI